MAKEWLMADSQNKFRDLCRQEEEVGQLYSGKVTSRRLYGVQRSAWGYEFVEFENGELTKRNGEERAQDGEYKI